MQSNTVSSRHAGPLVVDSPHAPQRPRLYTRSQSARHATWLELFFDLVFVLAIAELARSLHDDLTLGGVLGFIFLFIPVWWVWIGFTYYADLVDVDGPVYRVTMLAAMLLALALAISIPGALHGASATFAAVYVMLRLVLVGLYAWAWRHAREIRTVCARHALGFALGAAFWGASLFTPEPARYWLWAVGLLVEATTPIVVQLSLLTAASIQNSHLPERFGLFTLIALGEAVVVTGIGVADTAWAPRSVLVAAMGFALVGCLWWLYFDRVDETAVERAYTGDWRTLSTGFAWAYGHLAIYAGLAVIAVGIELAIDESASATFGESVRATLCGGSALGVLVITALQLLSPQRLPRSVLVARLITACCTVILVFAGAFLTPLALMSLLMLTFVGLTAFEVTQATDSEYASSKRERKETS